MSTRVAIGCAFAVIACFTFASVGQPCPGQGNATLTITSAELPAPGRRITLEVTGAPFRPFAVAADVGPGPVFRPHVGTICLDLGPKLVVLFNGIRFGSPVLGVDGRFAFDLNLPARAELGGRTFVMLALVSDPGAPMGFAIAPRLDVHLERAIVEDFSTADQRDDVATTAEWTGNGEARGVLSGTRTVTIAPTDSGFLLPHPLTTEGNRVQFLYSASDLAASPGESVMGIEWGPRSNFVFAATYSGTELLLGHARSTPDGLALSFQDNFDDAPVRVFSGDYAVPSSLSTTYFPWPTFATDFEYDSFRDLVFEVRVPPGAQTFQLFRNSSIAAVPRTRIVGAFGEPFAASGERTTYHARFSFRRVRSVAQSRFYDTGIDDPDYLPPALRIAAHPPGTVIALEVEGADDADRDGLPDPGSETGFRVDPDEIDGKRLVRFRVGFKANLDTGEVPSVGAVTIPFRR